MARPQKQGLDYWAIDVDFLRDVKLRKIMRACGANSPTILISLLSNIYRDYGYFIEWDDKDTPFLISDEIGVSEGAVCEVVKKALQVKFFDENLYAEYKILTSVGIQKRFVKASERRKQIELVEQYCLIDVSKMVNVNINVINVYNNEVNVYNNSINVYNNEQSKVKESKVKKSKGKESREEKKPARLTADSPPTLDEIKQYCLSRGSCVDPQTFYDFFNVADWTDSRGNKVKNWKQKLITWENHEEKKKSEVKKHEDVFERFGVKK